MTPERLAELKRLASLATPGPWISIHGTKLGCVYRQTDRGYTGMPSMRDKNGAVKSSIENSDFIAAFNPQTALELIDEIEYFKARSDAALLVIENEKTKLSAAYERIEGLKSAKEAIAADDAAAGNGGLE